MEPKDYTNPTSSPITTDYSAVKKDRKVVSGEVVKGRKSIGKQFADVFFETDLATLRSRIVKEMVIPSIKKIFVAAIEIWLFGDERPRGNRGGYNDYASYSNSNSKGNRSNADDRNRERPDYREYIFKEKADAEDVLASLREQIREYGKASIADFYDFAGVTSEFTENRYGWYTLDRAGVRIGRDGYYIDLPRAVLLS